MDGHIREHVVRQWSPRRAIHVLYIVLRMTNLGPDQSLLTLLALPMSVFADGCELKHEVQAEMLLLRKE